MGLERALGERIRRLVRVHPDGSETPLADRDTPPEALRALPPVVVRGALALDCVRYRSREVDLLVPAPDGTKRPVTVWCRPGREVALRWAEEPWRAPGSDRTVDDLRASLQAEHGLGPFRDGEGAWTAAELAVVSAALERVAPEEKALLQGIPFVRDLEQGVGLAAAHSAYYALAGSDASIVVLPEAFEDSVTGDPEAALPGSVLVILHEVGHAISRASLREQRIEADTAYDGQDEKVAAAREAYDPAKAAYDRVRALADAYNADTKAFNAEVAKYERMRARYERTTSADLRPKLEAASAALEVTIAALDEARAELDRETAELERLNAEYAARNEDAGRAVAAAKAETEAASELARRNPLLKAFGALPGARRGPTPYGATTVDEAFAESYALFRADPGALLRFSPEIHAWFARGEHLRWTTPGGSDAPGEEAGTVRP